MEQDTGCVENYEHTGYKRRQYKANRSSSKSMSQAVYVACGKGTSTTASSTSDCAGRPFGQPATASVSPSTTVGCPPSHSMMVRTGSTELTTPPSCSDDVGGLKTKISTALGGLLNKALNKRLSLSDSGHLDRPTPSPPPKLPARRTHVFNTELARKLITMPLLRLGAGGAADSHPYDCFYCDSRFEHQNTRNRHMVHAHRREIVLSEAMPFDNPADASDGEDSDCNHGTESSAPQEVLAHCKPEHGRSEPSPQESSYTGAAAAGEAVPWSPHDAETTKQQAVAALRELEEQTRQNWGHSMVRMVQETRLHPDSTEDTTTQCDDIDIKEEPVCDDHYSHPVEESDQIYIKEENVELEYGLETATGGSERERSLLKEDGGTGGSRTLATIGGPEGTMANSVRCTAKWGESRGNESGTRRAVPSCEKTSAEPNGHRRTDSGHSLLSCGLCPRTFKKRSSFRCHLHVHMRERQYSCSICGKTYVQPGHLKRHLLLHTEERPFTCSVCSKTFAFRSLLKKHSLQHTGEHPYSCGVCNKTFTQTSSLKMHSLLHTGERPYNCSLCSKTFTQRSHLTKHSVQHTGERPHRCSVCSKTFKLSSHLRNHLLLHTGQRPYSCSVCSKAFTLSSHLKAHARLHTGKRPYRCRVCNKAFTQSSSLKIHSLQHTGERPHSCSVCSKTFRQSYQLKIHSLQHTGERPYSCSVCSKTFRQSNHLKKHSLLHTR